ncbi:hypothetical protein ESCO_004902 [Escovopsis weberi]|uniref:Uncharacterized protein n=1 Tax=Escovopsis weberi TaxID=150374 RepID=A0A0M8MYD8_ESCWE|nr:hypothetical protein ESCO_004902 [Escovopsis weberi]
MSYYDNPQWSSGPVQNNWDHHGAGTPVRAGASGPQPQDEFAFSYQFDDTIPDVGNGSSSSSGKVDRAHENLQKSGKGYMMGARHGRMGGPRPHSVNNFDDARGSQSLHNFYAAQRHQSSRGSNEAEQVMQAKRRMAAQRERELRNLHTEQQYQRSVLSDVSQPGNKHMSEEETRELIARQRSALYGEGAFAEKGGYVDETGTIRSGPPGPSGPSSIRGHSPLTFDPMGRVPQPREAGTPGSTADHTGAAPVDANSRSQSTASPQTSGPTNKVFDNAVGSQSRTSTSSPTSNSPPRGDLAPGSKTGSQGNAVAPIGTRPAGTPTAGASAKRSTTPHTSSGGWSRGNVWGQSGLGAQASVWG